MKKIVLSVLALIVALMSTVVAVFGWLAVGTQIQPNYTGSVYSNYFASGKGTESEPFIINRSNHLYNLAWLQNNGEFNKTDESGNLTQQYYFKITADLNMTGYVLPPIGTKENPFVGNLDGGGYTISNLTVSNVKKDDELMPHEVSRIPKTYNTIGDGYTDIVGFFGVIGHHPDNDCNAKTLTDNKVSVSNLYLDNLTVRTRTSNTLIGLFAGYVCGNVSNIGVYRSLVSIGSEADTLDSTYSAHSNYALIGDYDKASTGWAATDTGAGEAGAGFGGSIDMKTLSRRVGYMITSMLENNENSGFKNTNYNYLVTNASSSLTLGGCLDTKSNFNLNVYKGGSIQDYLASGFYYQSASLTQTSNAHLESYFGNGTYLPLNIDLAAMNLADTDSSTDQNYSTTLSTISGTYYYNDIYKNGIDGTRKEVVSASNTGYIVGGASGDAYTSSAYVTLRITPLNYGYGTLDTAKGGRTIFKSLRYNMTYTSSGLDKTFTYSSKFDTSSEVAYKTVDAVNNYKNLDLVTIIDGKVYRIEDKYNKWGTDDNIAVTSDDTMSSGDFVRYNEVRDQFDKLLSNNLIYGLRFTNTPSSSNTIAGNVSINGTTYSNYALVKSAINFNLSQSGYMTAVLGGYSHGLNNQNGFKLYEVERNAAKSSISSFNEITSVWTNSSGDIQYNLSDTTGYTKVYDSSWYNGLVVPGTAYYVEIPLKAGDYCLGGASSSAYLMYLDIGANGGEGGSSGGETETDYEITGVRFVYNASESAIDYQTLENLYMFQIVFDKEKGTSGTHVYFLMTSDAMCCYIDVTIDTSGATSVSLTNENLSATSDDSSLKTNYGGTKEDPS
ncbi:MAG: hypothetical protein ACI4VK_00470 [Candidatus Coproplasma sp.]